MEWRRFVLVATAAMVALGYASCQKDDNKPEQKEPKTLVITFDDAPRDVMALDLGGSNLNSKSAPQGKQVTTGYFAKVSDATYVQFPINYAASWKDPNSWTYEYSNGGVAISNFKDMEQGDYLNQCSVYNKEGAKSGSNFAVCAGFTASKDDLGKCAKIYITDQKGYTVTTENKPATGKAKVGKFNSVWVCNTTYGYKVMQNGNPYTNGSLQSQNGWFKVIFIALDDKGKQIEGKRVEYYLANFDASRKAESGLEGKIREGWNQVDLSALGDNVSAIAVNFDGSDKNGEYVNTPAYAAMDDLSVTVSE